MRPFLNRPGSCTGHKHLCFRRNLYAGAMSLAYRTTMKRLVLIAIILFIVGCDSPEPTAVAEIPTATPVVEQPTDTPESIAATEVVTSAVESTFASGGLGQEEAWWNANHGSDGYITRVIDGKIYSIERQWSTEVTPDVALAEGELLMPADAVPVETYTPAGRPETTVHLYMSPSLAERFEPDSFIGGEPGNFIILYKTFDGEVPVMIMALGNNP